MSSTETRQSTLPVKGNHLQAATRGSAAGDRVPQSIGFHRTVYVELRKMVDTRAGRWLLGVMSALSLVVMAALQIWGSDSDRGYLGFLDAASSPLIMLLPIIGIMGATSEWTQRTGLVTFTLEPRRGRVVAAKVVASLVLGLVVVASCFAAAAVINMFAGGDWDLGASKAGGYVIGFAITVLQGVAFGMLFLNTPFAIVAALVLPTAWMLASTLISALDTAGQWLDLNRVIVPLFSGQMTGENWAQLATACGVWIVLPMTIGTWRVLTREVK